jgi:hypothetical protein
MIDVTHAAVGLVDIFIRQGLYKDRDGLPQPPYVPGLEVAGTVRQLGDGVDGLTVGEPAGHPVGDRCQRRLRGDYSGRRPRFTVSLASSRLNPPWPSRRCPTPRPHISR